MINAYEKIKNLFAIYKNKSICIKIIILTMIISALFAMSYFVGYRIISQSYNKLLYQSIAGSLRYEAHFVAEKLSAVESMSGAINSNKEIKKNLIVLSDEKNDVKLKNARNMISYLITDYHHNLRNSHVVNVSYFIDEKNIISSYPGREERIPMPVYHEVLRAAASGDGYPVWITDYCNEFGLFIARDNRRVNNHNYENIGTLIIQMDFRKLISSSAQLFLFPEDPKFIVSHENNVFFHSDGLPENILLDSKAFTVSTYGLTGSSGNHYFYVNGIFEMIPWEYKCLIPYRSIATAIRYMTKIYIIVVCLAIVIAILFSVFLSKSLAKQFDLLVKKMILFERNTLTYLSKPESEINSSMDEIDKLQHHFEIMAGQIQQLIRENYLKEILNKDAKLKALENQINPHFLYNTLESVNWRAKVINAIEISKMAESLGALLRITLQSSEANFQLKDELEIVNHYMTIQKLRFEDRLIYRFSVEPDLFRVSFPKLTIQPLLENAITYAMEHMIDSCTVEVCGYRDGKDIIVEVINDGSQFPADILIRLEEGKIVPHGFGIGLLNIQHRLRLIYGGEYGLTLFNSDAEHAVARIRIPG